MNKPVVVKRVLLSQIIALTGYAVICLFNVLLLVYLRVNRHAAFSGNAQATRKVILPAFEPLLWILAIASGSFAIYFAIALKLEIYTTNFPNLDGEVFYAARQFVFVLGLMFLCQKSVSVPAVRRAVAKSILLASYTVPIIWTITRFAPHKTMLFFLTRVTLRPLLLIFVVYVCFIHPPAGRASKFALHFHGAYIIVYHVMMIVGIVIQQYYPKSTLLSVTSYMVFTWGSFCPLVIWMLLRADTEYWRGMGQRVWSLERADRRSGTNFQGQVSEDILSGSIHGLIEAHRKFLIDFAHLEIKRKIGEGSSASVFCGRLRKGKSVAVKVYTPHRFSEEVVIEFSHEAALCASLAHPNIVEFYGMCVSPPTIGLVFELCQGSLEDILYAQAKSYSRSRAGRYRNDIGGDAVSNSFDHQQMLLNVAYMLDCARAVAYVHGFSPPLLHRDVKPANFLVDKNNNVKLTDFGDSRRLPRELPPNFTMERIGEPKISVETSNSSTVSSPGVTTPAPAPKMTVTGTVSYMAPELIGSRTGLASYGEAADVYSLAITFWDILFPDREKYPVSNNNPLIVFEGVLNGCRPPLEDSEVEDPNETIAPKLKEIISQSWCSDPNGRPTAAEIVSELEYIQEELLAVLAQDLSDDFGRLASATEKPSERCFTGEFLVERMEDLQVTVSRGEGIRLGHALMDAGFLHHLEHCKGFEASTSMYFFDHANINFCQPVAMLEESANTSPESDDEAYPQPSQPQAKSKMSRRSKLISQLALTFTSTGQDPCAASSTSGDTQTGSCACRLLGQHQKVPTKTQIPQSTSQSRLRQHKGSTFGLGPSLRFQSLCSNSNSSIRSSSSSSSGGAISSPKRWQPWKKNEEENSLTHKLLDKEHHTAIIIREDKAPPLAQPAA